MDLYGTSSEGFNSQPCITDWLVYHQRLESSVLVDHKDMPGLQPAVPESDTYSVRQRPEGAR